ncbi:MAG: molecular chaperone Hsp90 [Eubacteriales bacterium]|nr:molecular chaperone Hsp90 [Eubacteriales bacterium]
MTKETLQYVTEKTQELMQAFSCSQEAKEAARAWLDAVGTEKETEQTKAYLAELEEDIVTVDGLIGFAESEQGRAVFGEKAPEVAAHAKQIKAEGAKYCDCPACAAVEAILKKKADMLG